MYFKAYFLKFFLLRFQVINKKYHKTIEFLRILFDNEFEQLVKKRIQDKRFYCHYNYN